MGNRCLVALFATSSIVMAAHSPDATADDTTPVVVGISGNKLSEAEAERLADIAAANAKWDLRRYPRPAGQFKVVSGAGFWWFDYGGSPKRSDDCFLVIVNDSTREAKVYPCG
jgi:hypothetical protein